LLEENLLWQLASLEHLIADSELSLKNTVPFFAPSMSKLEGQLSQVKQLVLISYYLLVQRILSSANASVFKAMGAPSLVRSTYFWHYRH
jgi:hypothetical protein